MLKIIDNKIQCKRCKQIIVSRFRNDFQMCECGLVSADGGLEYLRRGGKSQDRIELSTYKEDKEK